ncbi:unnamed protein product [Alternaria sp. RS040]
MGVYRVEESPNNRAGCQVKECKDSGSKIMKGQFRYATQVTIKDHVSWQYRHWGCVTPKQIENLIETCGGDTDMVDGYDELPAEFQEKVDFALKNGHIPDEDCTRDPELNRPGVKKPRAKKAKKGAEDNDGEDAASPPKKKRATKAKKNEVKDEVEDEEEEEEAPAPAPKKRATKAKKVKAEDQDEQDVPAPAPAPKKRGRPAKKEVEEEDDDDEEAAPPAKKARASGRAKKAAEHTDASDKEAPKPKKARGKKATVENPDPEPEIGLDSEAEVLSDHAKEAPEPKKAPQKRGRKKAAAAAE